MLVSSEMVSIYFRLQPGEDHHGWRVVGNCSSLGNWDPGHGFPLNVQQETYWTSANPVTVPADVTLEYKYVYWAWDTYCWEDLTCNRTLHPVRLRMIVEDTENQPISKSHLLSFRNYSSRLSPFYFPEPSSPINFTGQEDTRVLIVSWTAPLLSSEGLLSRQSVPWVEHLYSAMIDSKVDFIWICGEEIPGIEKSALRKQNIVSVEIAADARAKHHIFVTSFLKPLFHSLVGGLSHFSHNLTELWDGYRTANSCVADTVMELYTGEEAVWLHDCELLLTPIFLTRRTKDPINIGLSLHHPIPPSEMFKLLPYRTAVLNSMLSCDLVEFEGFRYVRHFLRSCGRILEANCICREDGAIGVDYCGRFVTIGVGQMGLCPVLMEKAINSDQYKETITRLAQTYKGVTTWVSLDTLQPASGLLQKIAIFKAYLQSCHDPRPRLVQLYFQDRVDSAYQTAVQTALEALNIEAKDTAMELIPACESIETRLAYFSVSARYLNTAVKEGVSLPILEFILMHQYSPCFLVISEFSTLSNSLKSPAILNPFDVEVGLEVLRDHCSLLQVSAHDLRTAKYHTAQETTQSFLRGLGQARKNEKDYVYLTYGLSEGVKYVALSRNFATIFDSDILDAYRRARNRLILTDNEGTLIDIMHYTDLQGVRPSPALLDCLKVLSQDTRNSLYIATGRGKQTLDEMYSGIAGLGLVAEHGSFIKDQFTLFDWERVVPLRLEWLLPATDIISSYVSRLEGSFLDLKETAVRFSYTHIDPDYGSLQAQELISHLGLVMQPYQDQCEVVAGTDYVEVKPWGVSKGSTLVKIGSMLARKGPVDFILAIGDGVSDEEMFRELRKGMNSGVYACVVGMKPTSAQYYVTDRNEVFQLLDCLRHTGRTVHS